MCYGIFRRTAPRARLRAGRASTHCRLGGLIKRTKGRRGLDILKQMQEDGHVDVRIINDDFDDIQGVDSKLVRLGRELKAKVITNDYNLNKVAELQGVVVLNINDLANAMKPARVPGEEMTVLIVKAGKEEKSRYRLLGGRYDDCRGKTDKKYIGMSVPRYCNFRLANFGGTYDFCQKYLIRNRWNT